MKVGQKSGQDNPPQERRQTAQPQKHKDKGLKALLLKRRTAIVITAVVIVLATLLGAHRSLLEEAYPVQYYFVEGEDGHSIQSDLDARAGLASNLAVVAGRYLEPGDMALEELYAAIDELNGAETVSEKAEANQRLTEATERVYLALEDYPLSPADMRYRGQIRTDLASYNMTISHSDYNQWAEFYNEEILGHFPANVLGFITMVPELELFHS